MYACRFDRATSSLCRVADLIPLMVCIVDADGRFLFANRHCAGYLGRAAEELLGQRLAETIDLDDPAFTAADQDCAIRACIENDSDAEFVIRVRRPGGRQGRVIVKLVGNRADGVCQAFLTDLGEDALTERLERQLLDALARRY